MAAKSRTPQPATGATTNTRIRAAMSWHGPRIIESLVGPALLLMLLLPGAAAQPASLAGSPSGAILPHGAPLADRLGTALSAASPAQDDPTPTAARGSAEQAAGPFRWVTQTVDAPRLIKDMSARSLRLDPAGRPHIAYGADHLYYAWSDGAAWHSVVADGERGVGVGSSLALDAAGLAHISYCRGYEGYPRYSCNAVKYARQTAAGWQTEVVDNIEALDYSSIALDAAGNPRIAYNAGDAGVKYAFRTGSAWNKQIVDASPSDDYLDLDIALALDSQGHAHLAYGTGYFPSYALRYAYWNGTVWVTQTLASLQDIGFLSLALDAADHPRISYFSQNGSTGQ